jgi:hypothetical protein
MFSQNMGFSQGFAKYELSQIWGLLRFWSFLNLNLNFLFMALNQAFK